MLFCLFPSPIPCLSILFCIASFQICPVPIYYVIFLRIFLASERAAASRCIQYNVKGPESFSLVSQCGILINSPFTPDTRIQAISMCDPISILYSLEHVN